MSFGFADALRVRNDDAVHAVATQGLRPPAAEGLPYREGLSA